MDRARSPTGSDDERPTKKVKFSPQVSVAEFTAVPAKEAVTFHLLYGCEPEALAAEMQTGGSPFACEFYNQVFGDSEEINGYRGLAVHVWIALRSGHCCVEVGYSQARPGADDVLALMQAWWPKPLITNRSEFIQAATGAGDPDWSSMGTLLGSSISASVGLAEGAVQLYHNKYMDTPAWFKELHARLEPLLVFTIDGANFLDVDDPKWEVVAAVIHRGGHSYMAGFMTLYNFYAWPMSQRPRVSQVLVMPTLQRHGYGRALIAAAYSLAKQRDAIDLTFEDPAPGLQLLREGLEVEMMDAAPWLTGPADAALTAAAALEARSIQEAQKQQQNGAPAAAAAGPAANGVGLGSGAGNNAAGSAAAAAAAAAGSGSLNPAACLVMPYALQQRVTKELKIHKHQVLAGWEALLYLRSPIMGSAPSAAAAAAGGSSASGLVLDPLADFVTARLARAVSGSTDRDAANKKVIKVEGTEEDFIVFRLPKALRPPTPDDLGPDATVSVGRHTLTKVSSEEHTERVAEQAEARLDTLAALKARIMRRRAQAGL